MGDKGTIRKIVKKCRDKGKFVEDETAKLVKAGISAELLKDS